MNIITSSLSAALLVLTITTASAQINPNNSPDLQRNFETVVDKPVTVTLHENNNGTKITIPNGARVKVILESQAASTGFEWTQTLSSPDLLTLQKENFKKVFTDAVGAPCREVWVFKATAPGQTFVNFSLARPWEKEVPPLKEVQFDITVE